MRALSPREFGRLEPPVGGRLEPEPGVDAPRLGGRRLPARADGAVRSPMSGVRELRKASRAANFAATLRAGVDSQGAFR